jgi:hypothetical protein
MSIRPLAVLVIVAVAASLDAGPAQAQAFALAQSSAANYTVAEHRPKQACAGLAAFRSKELASIEAREVGATDAAPAHCRVTGVLAPEIAFEVSLPARWNGRFYMIGNGGHAGESLDDPGRAAQRVQALQNGFAFGQTNTGHNARQEPGASFVLSNPQKAQDYAWRAVHLTAVTAKAITAEYFGRKVARAYWNSCSNGGRQGLLEAQRFPADFDGVVANAPWVSQTGFTMGAVWNQQVLSKAPLTPGKLQLLAARVAMRCDAIDGLPDGLIDDPRRCDFDAARDVPACTAGADDDSCLTPAQADAVMKVYRGPQAGGRQVFPGFMPGSEAVVAGPGGATNSAWWGLVVPTPERAAADYGLAANTLRFLAHRPPKPDYDPMTFDFTRDPPLLDAWAREVNATSTDLARFRRRGGKVLMTYGWADQVLQPLMGVQYYEQVAARYGADTTAFFRLFMVPGMTHCAGGVGPDQFDAVTAVIDWVERGKAPDSLLATKFAGGKAVRTRPLCPYPQVAKYAGTGSQDDAANFRCALP